MAPSSALGSERNHADGFVYVMSNASDANSVLVYEREENGTLIQTEEVLTQGKGSGGSKDPLGSQGALALTPNYLVAVNAGSNNISLMTFNQDGVQFESKASSHGTFPISVTTFGDLVYVVNSGATPNIAGFRVTADGKLRFIQGSNHALPGGVGSGPGEISFTPDGNLLIVTEKNTNMIDVFGLNDDGSIANVVSVASVAHTPFGFAFGRRGTLLISETNGTPTGSTISSYMFGADEAVNGVLQPVTKALPIQQRGTCWVFVTRNGRYAFTTNTASDTIASFRVANDGSLTLIANNAGTTPAGSLPTDMALSADGRFLYVVGALNGSLDIFSVDKGMLNFVTTVAGIPVSAQGIAAR